ncbi:ATP-binding protein [Undibacterium sp. TS12]|uniref:hybrid sensor histidine kinase/response regulator n=1 Tax=Undibacterium sp. TS12 TaxID=2908202 RepID=UPI001F4C68D7|nr:ATP-binding protein [Undibacterium sp. TS12]MCH8618988.1 PAS domain-containing protein [Undibacterium sp. TS12]
MATQLALLMVEDSDMDAELVMLCLRRADFDVRMLRVETESEMREALSGGQWDVILSDYNLPRFDTNTALGLLRESGLDLPFIVVSAELGENAAVALMKAGAHDYVMKDNLARLPPAIKREMSEASQRQAHRQAVEALRESEERWSFALEGAGYGVSDWDIKTGHVLYSQCWVSMHGYEIDEIPATVEGGLDLVHPDELPLVKAAMQAYFDGAMPRYHSEHRLRCKDGSWKWVVDRGMIVSRDENGQPMRMICTHVDISERKQAEEELRILNEQLELRVEERTRELRHAMTQIIESEKLASLGVLVAGVSHELNTPIGNMLLAASTLAERLKEVHQSIDSGKLTRSGLMHALDECSDASQLIVRSGGRASELIESFKRVSVDQTSQRRRLFDVRIAVQDSINALGGMINRMGVSVDNRIPQGLMMDSFPGHLEQIINNLIMNSLTHGFETGTGKHIIINASLQGEILALDYADDGIGIPPDLHHKVFEPFYTSKLGQGGSGLGLYIVHNLVQGIFKGSVRLESSLDQGVHLFFHLPLVTPEI